MKDWSEAIFELGYVWPILPRCHKVNISSWFWGDIFGQEIPNLHDPYIQHYCADNTTDEHDFWLRIFIKFDIKAEPLQHYAFQIAYNYSFSKLVKLLSQLHNYSLLHISVTKYNYARLVAIKLMISTIYW